MKEIVSPCKMRTLIASVGMPPDCNLYATNNFSWQELLANQKEPPTLDILENLLDVARVLQVYRDKVFHGSPITITSGWRSNSYNQELKKRGYKPAANSQHLYGKAVDFIVKGYNSQQVYDLLDPVHFGGIERDAKLDGMDWTHIDIRGNIIRISNSDWSKLPDKFNWDKHNKLFR